MGNCLVGPRQLQLRRHLEDVALELQLQAWPDGIHSQKDVAFPHEQVAQPSLHLVPARRRRQPAAPLDLRLLPWDRFASRDQDGPRAIAELMGIGSQPEASPVSPGCYGSNSTSLSISAPVL